MLRSSKQQSLFQIQSRYSLRLWTVPSNRSQNYCRDLLVHLFRTDIMNNSQLLCPGFNRSSIFWQSGARCCLSAGTLQKSHRMLVPLFHRYWVHFPTTFIAKEVRCSMFKVIKGMQFSLSRCLLRPIEYFWPKKRMLCQSCRSTSSLTPCLGKRVSFDPWHGGNFNIWWSHGHVLFL